MPSGAHAGKNIFDKEVPSEEMITGLLKMMPVGVRTCTYIPAIATKLMSGDEGEPMVGARGSHANVCFKVQSCDARCVSHRVM